MSIEVRKISYSWDSTLENAGLDAYRLDCFVWKDGSPVVDRHDAYRTKAEFFEALSELVPLLETVPPAAQDREDVLTQLTTDAQENGGMGYSQSGGRES